MEEPPGTRRLVCAVVYRLKPFCPTVTTVSLIHGLKTQNGSAAEEMLMWMFASM